MFVLKISCSWFVILSALHAAATQRSPQTRVLLVGDGLELLCNVGNGSTVMWDITPPSDTTKSVLIASSRNQPANNRYKVDCNTPEACRLLISDIRQTDAGLYRCTETTAQSGIVSKPLADLTVLAVPTCIALKSHKTSYLLDGLRIRCQVNYSGTEQPFIHCRELSAKTSPSPATPVDSGNSSYHSLSFTYDIVVDRITKETGLECTTSLNMKDFPHGHVQYTWRWSSNTTDEENRVERRSGASTTTSGEASSSSLQGLDSGLTLAVVGILVATFVVFMLLVVFIHCRLVSKRIERNYNNQTVVHPDSHGHEQGLVQPRPIYDELGSVAVAGNIADYDHIVQAERQSPKVYTRLNIAQPFETH